MKVAFFILITVGIAGYAIYYVGGAASFDPVKQAKEDQAKLKPGMSWTQVLTIAPKPDHLVTFHIDPKSKQLMPSSQSFDREVIERSVKAGDFKNGFAFHYVYSVNATFDTFFDTTGKLVDVAESGGLSDLFKR